MKTTILILATGGLASAQLTRLYSIPPEHGGDGADPTNTLSVAPPGRGPVGPIGTVSGGRALGSSLAGGPSSETVSHPNGGFLSVAPGPVVISTSSGSNATKTMSSNASAATSGSGSAAATTTQAGTGSATGTGSAVSGSSSGSAAAASSTAGANPAAAPTGIAGGLAAVIAMVGLAAAL